MQSRQGLSPLAIVLPHPQLPLRRPSRLSLNSSSSPQTPRSCPSPALPIFYPANRKSTDSWNSSNADELEFEWLPDQVLLLSRTLDALPAHLVTPFNGPIPPSNLLDKIARGVSQAKGPVDWPHSIRATRVKLIELARARAIEDNRDTIHEEVEIDDDSSYSYQQDGCDKPLQSLSSRRPLYRQSSMDFIKPNPSEIKDNAAIARLSSRLQRTHPTYHPYNRPPTNHRSSSPPPLTSDTSTPSSTTLSFSSNPRALHRSASTLSTNSTSMFSNSSLDSGPLRDPRLQRVKCSDSTSFPPIPPPKDYPASSIGFKRAPSYGTLAQEAKKVREIPAASYPSSDEEEKIRTRRAKKPKTKSALPLSPASSPPATAPNSPLMVKPPPPPPKDKVKSPKPRLKGVASTLPPPTNKPSNKTELPKTGKPKDKEGRPLPMNLQRNPSMFGPELPHLRQTSPPPAFIRGGTVTPPKMRSPSPPPTVPTPQTPTSPTATQKVKTLRRVRRLPPARRISFGSLLAPGDEADVEGDGDVFQDARPLGSNSLGSAFQLI